MKQGIEEQQMKEALKKAILSRRTNFSYWYILHSADCMLF